MSFKYEAAKKFHEEYRSWQQPLYQKTGGKFQSLQRKENIALQSISLINSVESSIS